MVVVYVGSFPSDPETELKNFQRKQAEYEAAWRATSDPQVLYEAILNARDICSPRGIELAGDSHGRLHHEEQSEGKRKGKASQTVERFRERMHHVQRYRCVRDLRQKDHTKDEPWIWQSSSLQPEARQPRGGRLRTVTTGSAVIWIERDIKASISFSSPEATRRWCPSR